MTRRSGGGSGASGFIRLNWMTREGLTEKVTAEQSPQQLRQLALHITEEDPAAETASEKSRGNNATKPSVFTGRTARM